MHLIDYDSFIKQIIPPHWVGKWEQHLIYALCYPLKARFEEQRAYRFKALDQVNQNSQVMALERHLNEINGFKNKEITIGDAPQNGYVRVILENETPEVIASILNHFNKVKIAGKRILFDDIKTPTNLTASIVNYTQVALTWKDNSKNEFGYELWRASGTGNYTKHKDLPANAESYTDTETAEGTTYRYKVLAKGSSNSDFSNEVSIVTLKAFVITTKKNTATQGNFVVSIDYTGTDTPKWVFSDGSSIDGENISTNKGILNGTQQEVKLFVSDITKITKIDVSNQELVGGLDFTGMSGLLDIRAQDNNMTVVPIFPQSQNIYSHVSFARNKFNGVLDLTYFENCNAFRFDFDSCGITGLIMPSVHNRRIFFGSFSNYSFVVQNRGKANNLGENLDLSTLNIGFVIVSHSSYLKTLKINPALNYSLYAHNCNLTSIPDGLYASSLSNECFLMNNKMTGSFDFSKFRCNTVHIANNLFTSIVPHNYEYYDLSINNNPITNTNFFWVKVRRIFNAGYISATTITFPQNATFNGGGGFTFNNNQLTAINGVATAIGQFIADNLSFENCNLSTSLVNKLLNDMLISSNLTGNNVRAAGVRINLQGNSAPDSSSGGIDGIAAMNTLSQKNIRVEL